MEDRGNVCHSSTGDMPRQGLDYKLESMSFKTPSEHTALQLSKNPSGSCNVDGRSAAAEVEGAHNGMEIQMRHVANSPFGACFSVSVSAFTPTEDLLGDGDVPARVERRC